MTAVLTIEQAAAAIVAIINTSPRSPRQSEIQSIVAQVVPSSTLPELPISDLELQLLEAIANCDSAEQALSQVPDDDDDDAEARYAAALDHVDTLAAKLPNPTAQSSPARNVLLARVAFLHSDKGPDGRMALLTDGSGHNDERAFARLIHAVLASAGINVQ